MEDGADALHSLLALVPHGPIPTYSANGIGNRPRRYFPLFCTRHFHHCNSFFKHVVVIGRAPALISAYIMHIHVCERNSLGSCLSICPLIYVFFHPYFKFLSARLALSQPDYPFPGTISSLRLFSSTTIFQSYRISRLASLVNTTPPVEVSIAPRTNISYPLRIYTCTLW